MMTRLFSNKNFLIPQADGEVDITFRSRKICVIVPIIAEMPLPCPTPWPRRLSRPRTTSWVRSLEPATSPGLRQRAATTPLVFLVARLNVPRSP
jgi:hypothetical protein